MRDRTGSPPSLGPRYTHTPALTAEPRVAHGCCMMLDKPTLHLTLQCGGLSDRMGGALLSVLLDTPGPRTVSGSGHGASSGLDVGFSWPLPFFPMSFLFPSCSMWHPRHWPSPTLVLGMRFYWALPLGRGQTPCLPGSPGVLAVPLLAALAPQDFGHVRVGLTPCLWRCPRFSLLTQSW